MKKLIRQSEFQKIVDNIVCPPGIVYDIGYRFEADGKKWVVIKPIGLDGSGSAVLANKLSDLPKDIFEREGRNFRKRYVRDFFPLQVQIGTRKEDQMLSAITQRIDDLFPEGYIMIGDDEGEDVA